MPIDIVKKVTYLGDITRSFSVRIKEIGIGFDSLHPLQDLRIQWVLTQVTQLSDTMLYLSRFGIFYFRFQIPQDLHPLKKQSSIRVSLGTRCRRDALHLAHALSYTGKQLLNVRGYMDYQAIRNMLHEHFRQFLEYRKAKIDREGPLTEAEKRSLSEKNWLTLDTLYDREINRLIASYGLPVKEGDPEYPVLRTEFIKAHNACCDAVLKYNGERTRYDFEAPLSLPMKKQRKLADTIEEYITEKLRLKQWREHIARDYRGQLNLLVRYLGQDASLQVSDELARDVKNMLILMPKNASIKPALRDLSIQELMQVEGHDRLNPVTVSKLLLTYSTFYDWAVKNKYTEENNFKSMVDDVKKVHAEREAFSPEDIKRIFAAAMEAKKPAQKWGTLIAFYTGARLNEIAQLETSDIIQQNGIWCFNFSDSGDMQRLKNKSSRRIIPVHSHLINLGFMDYVKRQGKGRLFPELTFHKTAGYGRNLGRWFNDVLLREQLGIKSKALVFHSIRHTVAQKLRSSGVDEPTRKDIMGHSHDDVHHKIYAKAEIELMAKAIEKIEY